MAQRNRSRVRTFNIIPGRHGRFLNGISTERKLAGGCRSVSARGQGSYFCAGAVRYSKHSTRQGLIAVFSIDFNGLDIRVSLIGCGYCFLLACNNRHIRSCERDVIACGSRDFLQGISAGGEIIPCRYTVGVGFLDCLSVSDAFASQRELSTCQKLAGIIRVLLDQFKRTILFSNIQGNLCLSTCAGLGSRCVSKVLPLPGTSGKPLFPYVQDNVACAFISLHSNFRRTCRTGSKGKGERTGISIIGIVVRVRINAGNTHSLHF